MTIRIDAGTEVAPFAHFWGSTGFTPASLLLTPMMRQTLQYVGGVARKGVLHIRIHYLLELVSAKNLGTDRPLYDWSDLDRGLDLLVENGLRPFFELMGNPGHYWTDYTDRTQLEAWKRLVRDLALHCIDRYGADEVRGWYFETYNEPDIPNGWWKHGDEALLNYYDACSEGLKEADPKLVFGGPGTCRQLSPTLKALLAHCDSGTNYFTGETGVRMDFLSVHEKGQDNSVMDLDIETDLLMRRTHDLIDYVAAHHPRLKDVPVMNNECDPQVGWSVPHTWRATSFYAAWVARLTDRHLREIRNDRAVPFVLLGNDNGFLGEWGVRSHLAAFFDKAAPVREENLPLLQRPGFELIKKPVFNLMTLLAMLGDRQVSAENLPGDGRGVMATRRGRQVALLVYHATDKVISSGEGEIDLRIDGLEDVPYRLAHWRLDESHGNPYAVWARSGKPWKIDADRLAAMRRVQEPALLEPIGDRKPAAGSLSLSFPLPLHGVSLILLTPEGAGSVAPVQDLRAEMYRGVTDRENVLLQWTDATGTGAFTLHTYEVLYAPTEGAPFVRVNEADLLDTTFMHVRDPNPDGGRYRIRAVDVWGNATEGDTPLVLPGV